MARKVRQDWKDAQLCIPDKAAALAESTFAIGSLFGPIIGGRLTDQHGYRHMLDLTCLGTVVCAVLNFLIFLLPSLFVKDKEKMAFIEEDEKEEKAKAAERMSTMRGTTAA